MSDAPTTPKPTIEYDDFAKLDLRIGKVVEVAAHPNADKLVVLKVDLGSETRQILAGIRAYYSPEALLGREIVVVANLAPRKMRGLESQGMLLAASARGPADPATGEAPLLDVVVLGPEKEVPPGSTVS
ncbi:MAG: methionine--tRNA ligase subunit beta [Planctomycetaceae bacterium]|nr:methionine--tRNA ligase subunit beta [Planctomycetaceae bacterium]